MQKVIVVLKIVAEVAASLFVTQLIGDKIGEQIVHDLLELED